MAMAVFLKTAACCFHGLTTNNRWNKFLLFLALCIFDATSVECAFLTSSPPPPPPHFGTIGMATTSAKRRGVVTTRNDDGRPVTTVLHGLPPQGDKDGHDRWRVHDSDLLVGDLLALVLVAQLLGFTDAVTAPNFVADGGFNQPVPAVPDTLGTLVARLSAMDVAWLVSSFKNRGYTADAVADDGSAVRCGLTVWLDYCSLRIVLAVLDNSARALRNNNNNGTFNIMDVDVVVDGYDLLRQCWFTLPILIAFRVIFSRSRTGRL